MQGEYTEIGKVQSLPSGRFQSMKKGNTQQLKYSTEFKSATEQTDRQKPSRRKTIPNGKVEDFWEEPTQENSAGTKMGF